MVHSSLRMSTSAMRRKSYKKAQGQTGPFSPVHWDKADGGQVHAGKLQVMEKFFTPLQQPKEGKGSERELSQCHQQWMERRIGHFSSSSSAASSTTAASWSSEASLEKEAFLAGSPRSQPKHAQSCVDISREARTYRRSGERTASYKAEGSVSFPRLKKGHSQSVDRLSQPRCPQQAQSLSSVHMSRDSRLYKASSLERNLVFSEQAEILAPRLQRQPEAPAPSKSILKNGIVAKGDGLHKAKSIETIPVRTGESEPWASPPPRAEEELERQPELGATKKHHSMDQMKLVAEKLRFSEFLNEITRQVMSPSSLSSLGWKPPEASRASKSSGIDSSESKSSGSKASSQGSLTESREGQHQQETGPRGKRRGTQRDHTNSTTSRHTDNGSSSEMGTAPQTKPGSKEQRPGEGRLGHGVDTEGHEQPPTTRKVEKEQASSPDEPWSKDQPLGTTQKGGTHCKELELQAAEMEPAKLSRDNGAEHAEGAGAGAKSGPAEQQEPQLTWEELESLKEKFSRLQEDYSNTQRTNQLLEEKLHLIVQSMAAERQILNQRITELLERLISAQNTICTLERLNISVLLSESAGKHRPMEKADSTDSLYSLRVSNIAPPPAFMDSASEAPTTTPSQSDSATEANKPGCSSESDTAAPNGDRTLAPTYHGLLPPGQLESHRRATAFTPWKQQHSGELPEHVNSTESECSTEEGAQVHVLPMPRFLYLRQAALMAPSVPTLPSMEALRPSSPQGLVLSGQLELGPVPEFSSTDSSDGEEAWSQGLGEKKPGVTLDYQSAQKILDSLLRQHHGLEKEPVKVSRGGYQDRSETGQAKEQQCQIRYYSDFKSPGEEQPPRHQAQHGGGTLPRAKGRKVLPGEHTCGAGVMDSTLL